MKTFAFCLALLLPLAAAAQMYKWVDEKGRTVYSETPPPDGKGAKVDIRPSGPATAPGKAEGTQKGGDAGPQRIPKEPKAQEKPQEVSQASARRDNCAESQRRLKAAVDDKDSAREAHWRNIVKKYCE